MATAFSEPAVTICLLTFGDHAELARRAVGSMLQHLERRLFRLVVGANTVGQETREYLESLKRGARIDDLIFSEVNLGKCPMMRLMFQRVRTEFVWWFDDDSFVTAPEALSERLRIARSGEPEVVMWGEQFMCDYSASFYHCDPVAFVRSAAWYQGLTPPFWEPGGKGEFDFEGKGTGDGRWFFMGGGGWFIRTCALEKLDWPDPRLWIFGEDVFLGEAIRQHGWQAQHIGKVGVEINAATRRWSLEEERLRSVAAI